ncbi:MAG: hypothetical protein JWO10_2026, partial [Microbacteriaceae bacterium]|nr:hypothetical protein [Microbacteriaceae bacterium]
MSGERSIQTTDVRARHYIRH